MARISEAQLALLGWGPDGGPRLASGVPQAVQPTRPASAPRVDPDGFDFIDLTYRGPIVPKGRHRFSSKNGAFHSDERTERAERDLVTCMRLAQPPGFQPLECELQLIIEIRYPVPRSWPKKRQADALVRRIRPNRRPDVDNVVKLIADSGNRVLWVDDAQIASLAVERVYAADAPAIWLRVRRAPLSLPWEPGS